MGRIAWKALPFMRPMMWHIIVILSLGFAMGAVVAFATTLGMDLFTNKVLIGDKIQPMQAFLLGLDDSYVVEAVDLDGAAADAGLTDDQRRTVRTRMLVWFIAMGAFGLLLFTVLRYYGAWVWQNVSQYLRVTMIERLEHLSLRFHSDSRSGDAIYRIIQDSAQIVNLLREAIINPITMVYALVIALTFITAFDALLLLGVALVAVPAVALTVVFTPRIRRRSVASRVAGSNLTSRLQETFAALKVVKASRAERLMLERFDVDSNRALDAARAPDEGTELVVPGRKLDFAPTRPGQARRPQERGQRRRPVEEIQPVAASPDDEDCAHLLGGRLHRADVVVQRVPMAVEHGPHLARRRGSAEYIRLLRDRVPHPALVRAPAAPFADRMPNALELLRPPPRVLHTVGHVEVRRPVRPPPRLDARHGNDRGALGRDQHGQVGDPVLLGADEFLAIHDKQGTVGPVLHLQVGDAAPYGHLAHGHPVLAKPVSEQQVIEIRGLRRKQGEHRESAAEGWFADFDAGDGGPDLVHLSTP